MALTLDWSSLDEAGAYVMKGDGFVVNDYGHPSYLRYVEGPRTLTLSYEYFDDTPRRGRRLLFFRSYSLHVEVPTEITWDDGSPLEKAERARVLERICRTLEAYKKRPCTVLVNDRLYEELARAQSERARRKQNAKSTV